MIRMATRLPPCGGLGKTQSRLTLSLEQLLFPMLQQTGNSGMITVNYAYALVMEPAPILLPPRLTRLPGLGGGYDARGVPNTGRLGNEDGGPWEASYKINTAKNQDGQPQIISGALYGKHFLVFADSMREAATEVGATIYIGVQTIPSDASNSWNPPDRTWDTGVFGSIGNGADFFIVHDYFGTSNNASSTADQILAVPAPEAQSDMQYMLQAVKGYGVNMKPIALRNGT